MKTSKLPMFLCLSLAIGLTTGISAQSEAKGRVAAKNQKQSQHNKVKKAKLQRKANRKARPQRRLASLKLKTTRLNNVKAKAAKRAAGDQKVIKALKNGNIKSLMTVVKGTLVLNFEKFTPTARIYLRKALSDGPQSRYTIEFGSILGAERVEIAKASFPGHGANPLAKEAWARASGANSVSVKLNVIEFGSGKSKTTYTNTMIGTIRTRFSNGKKINESARWNRKTDKWSVEQF